MFMKIGKTTKIQIKTNNEKLIRKIRVDNTEGDTYY